MPPKYTAAEIEEQKKVAEQLRKIDLFLRKNPEYQPHKFEKDFDELNLINYMKGQIDDMLIEGLYTQQIGNMIRFLNLREKVLKEHIARPIANFNAYAKENSEELNKLANGPPKGRPAKRAKRGGGRATRRATRHKRSGTRRGTRRA